MSVRTPYNAGPDFFPFPSNSNLKEVSQQSGTGTDGCATRNPLCSTIQCMDVAVVNRAFGSLAKLVAKGKTMQEGVQEQSLIVILAERRAWSEARTDCLLSIILLFNKERTKQWISFGSSVVRT